MFTVEGGLQLRRWAQNSLELMFDHVGTLPWDKLLVPLEGFGFQTLRSQLAHLTGAEAFWMHLLLNRPWPGWLYHDAPDFVTLRISCEESYALTREYLQSITDAELQQSRELVFPGGGRGSFTPALVVHHVVTHAFHHKGQVVAMCRLLGHPAPETDLDANAGNE